MSASVRLSAAMFLLSVCAGAQAQTYPTRPIHWIVAFTAGGPNDVLTRAIAPPVAASLGQPVVVDNRAASAGIAGTEAAAKAAPDGYTVLTATSGLFLFQKALYKKLPYDPDRDFAPVSQIANGMVGLFVHQSVPARTVKELVAYAKANPGKLNYASAGVGQPFHLAMERFNDLTGTKMVHVPYKGAAQFIPDLLAGRIDLIFYPTIDQLVAQVNTGKLRALAVATDRRLAAMPEVPTFAEAGMPDFTASSWIGVVVPAGTPKEIVERLSREIGAAVASPDVAKVYAQLNMSPTTSSPDQFSRFIREESAKWGPWVKSLGITVD